MNDIENKNQDEHAQSIDVRESIDIKESIIEIENRFLKLASIQTILSVAAVFTGAIALYAALTESHAVRKQTAASVWPYVQTVINDTNTSESAYIKISLNNVGVGPAKMQGVLLHYKGEFMRDWDSFVRQLDDNAELGVTYGKSDVNDRVLAPEESLVIFQTSERKLVQRLQDTIYQGELGLSYCYCSIFDDCWLKPLPDSEGTQKIESIDQCPDNADDNFL
ncbi:hypothetical protein GCM10011365_04060 [Marinicella pacifica]|uniref:Uncharacterized protein n=1 Tax=Marinicella pacifica TaxID=1171543 RepID=A0A917CFX1_9GAMM|nr:hypothetical protein [Marinicella pacifica]GGF86210.1 hypothetical protein GCM10011365_04060 [Marinicella pacifica]